MTEKKFTQRNLALEMGISAQSLNGKLNGRVQFTLKEVLDIMNLLEIDNPNDYFFTSIDPNTQH